MSEAVKNDSAHLPPESSSGEGQEEDIYFKYSATLRIFGTIPDLDEITAFSVLVKEEPPSAA